VQALALLLNFWQQKYASTPPPEHWGFSAKIFGDALALCDSIDGKKYSPHFHGGSPYGNREADKKNPIWGLPISIHGDCAHSGINIGC